jgi:hypothetical protein
MKKLKYYLGLVALIMIAFSGCKKNESPLTNQQEATKLLNGVWGNAQVISSPIAGATGTLNNLVLTFAITDNLQPLTFSASGAPEYFPSGSTWKWVDATTFTAIQLEGNFPITDIFIDELTATNLTINFVLNGPAGGRVSGIGEYTVSFTKQ